MLKEPLGVNVAGKEGKLALNEFEGVVVTTPRHAKIRIFRIRSRESTELFQHLQDGPSLVRGNAALADGRVSRVDPQRALPARAPRSPLSGVA